MSIKSDYKRQVMTLAGGTAMSQVAYLLTLPIISRLYLPDDFGYLSFLQSLLIFLLAVTSMQYEMAILIPEDKPTAVALLVISFCTMFGMTALSTVVLWCLVNSPSGPINLHGMEKYWWLLPIGQLGAGSYQILSQWAVRERQFSNIARSKVTQVVTQVCSQIILGLLKVGTLGLLVGDTIGRCSGGGSFLYGIWKNRKDLFHSLSYKQLMVVALRYKHFPLIATGSNLFFVGTLQLPPIILVNLYGASIAGQYGLIVRIGQAPILLISKSISQVFMADAPALSRDNPRRLKHLFMRSLIQLTKLAIIPCLLAFLFSPQIFPLLFGQAWREAGVFMRLLSPMLFFSFLCYPFLSLLNLLEKQKWQLVWDVSRCFLTVGSFIFVHLLRGPATIAILLYSCIMSLMAVIYIGLCLYLIQSLINQEDKKVGEG